MLIGILSDSHGRAEVTGVAVRMLLEHGAQRLIHLGDIGDVRVIDALVERADEAGLPDPPVHIVLGNCDYHAQPLIDYAEGLGVTVDHPIGRLEIEGKTVAFTHGHLHELMREAVAEGADYLLHGHTHRVRDEVVGGTRIINPGALFRASEHTAAVLDVKRGVVQVLVVPGDKG